MSTVITSNPDRISKCHKISSHPCPGCPIITNQMTLRQAGLTDEDVQDVLVLIDRWYLARGAVESGGRSGGGVCGRCAIGFN